MQTTKYGNIIFQHNGDFRGDVFIQEEDGLFTVMVPMASLIALVAKAVQQKKLQQLENASPEELLGLGNDI